MGKRSIFNLFFLKKKSLLPVPVPCNFDSFCIYSIHYLKKLLHRLTSIYNIFNYQHVLQLKMKTEKINHFCILKYHSLISSNYLVQPKHSKDFHIEILPMAECYLWNIFQHKKIKIIIKLWHLFVHHYTKTLKQCIDPRSFKRRFIQNKTSLLIYRKFGLTFPFKLSILSPPITWISPVEFSP